MGSVKKKANATRIRPVRGKEIRELSSLPWVRDETLSSDSYEARVLSDGRVLRVSLLLTGPQTGGLFPSRASAEEAHRAYLECCREAAKGPVDNCARLLPQIDDFLRDVEAHAKSLGPRLRIPDEVLDGTPESLDVVDKALKRIPWAKRQVPDLVTPLVAYLGEVMRKGCGGRWTKAPTTKKLLVPVFDPAELETWRIAGLSLLASAAAAGAEAWAERMIREHLPKPRREEIEVPSSDNANEPMIEAPGGRQFQPFVSVFLPMVEPSRRIPLRSSPGVPYDRPAKKAGGSPT